MPLWTAMFLRGLHHEPVNISDFAIRGDFALYSAAFLAPAIYSVAASVKRESSFLQTGAMTLLSIALAFSAIVFTSVSPDLLGVSLSSPHVWKDMNLRFMLVVSWLLLIFAFSMAFVVFLNESYREEPNLRVADEVEMSILRQQVDLKKPTPTELRIPQSKLQYRPKP